MTSNGKPRQTQRDAREIWDDLLHEAAEQAVEDRTLGEDDLQWASEVNALVSSHLAALRRQLTPRYVPIRRGVKIPPRIQTLDRWTVVAQLEDLRRRGLVSFAHQDLTGLTDRDLRQMLTVSLEVIGGDSHEE